jgi:SAM-dependent methyltransferase
MDELHEYTEEFFEYIERGSIASAKRFAAFMVPLLRINSVLDVGCGRGAWLREWKSAGVQMTRGVDGPYVRVASLLIAPADFQAVDLSRRFDLNERFDLVTCLEVAEHLAPDSSAALIDSLVAHSNLVLFSAATPGQGGENHVNEQPLAFWQNLFSERGYVGFDVMRQGFRDDPAVEPWYRYNSVLYAALARVADLPQSVRNTRVEGRVREIGCLSWFVRRSILRFLPVETVTLLSKWNYRRLNKAYRSRRYPRDPGRN